ncbi:PREDICTED: esterase OVCA2-like isoform X2 [Tarenaya hassleriana]|uniref:esterase OVCA2-like isoform X2 n=1 Tax=Tarenaya hassleriana TaxID=28532 RepID=UPI00053C7114|nr:PREDICTED: esterase OVCA2-like isoform X2 [Tarenaya hassleriana]
MVCLHLRLASPMNMSVFNLAFALPTPYSRIFDIHADSKMATGNKLTGGHFFSLFRGRKRRPRTQRDAVRLYETAAGERFSKIIQNKTNKEIGSFELGNEGAMIVKKPRLLCLHGFRTSGEIMKKQIQKWPESVLDRLDLVFLDAPFPSQGKSVVEAIFDPPYYEWFQTNKEFNEYTNFEKCLEYIEDYIIKHGPFDGFAGFSQGAILSGGLPGLQAAGIALRKVPKIKFLIIIGGGKFKSPSVAEKAYSSLIEIPSLHFLGEKDFLKPYGIELIESFKDPVVVHHPKGHAVPRLADEKSLESVLGFVEKMENILTEEDRNDK